MPAVSQSVLQKAADTIRILSAEGVQQADSGHPGLPMGCAEIGAVLFGKLLRHNPKNPKWMGRDRFVLSAGHGSMFIYSCLHLSGYALPIEQLKSFRQLHSMTPGHPEYGEAPGVETTTGPLGQGIATGIGMGLAQKLLGARLGNDLFDAKIWILAGDGCLMEGISSEASSLAGTLKLGNVVVIYDSNDICLDGPTKECFTEDTAKRYEAYGWNVLKMNGNDVAEVEATLTKAREEKSRPTLVIAKTKIGKGSPKKEGTSSAHGAPLGKDELEATKKAIGWTEEPFGVPAEVREFFAARLPECAAAEEAWNKKLAALKADPAKAALWDACEARTGGADFADKLWAANVEPNKATRAQGQQVIGKVAELAPFFYSGSADLSCSDLTAIKGAGVVSADDYGQRVIKFGVREFAMAAMNYGMWLHGMIQPLCGTFFTFSDYMKNAIRVASLMKARVFFQFTHDSIFLGEDGPTHQPIEHLAGLRAMPGLTVFRPADENELKASWIEMFKANGPSALILSRQNIKSQGDLSAAKAREGVARGAYVLCGAEGDADVLIVATGAELGLATDVAKVLEGEGKQVRVVSMPSWELFDAQDAAYKAKVLGGKVGLKVSIEAASTMGWHKYVGSEGLAIGIDTFGASAPAKELAKLFGLTTEQVVERIKGALKA